MRYLPILIVATTLFTACNKRVQSPDNFAISEYEAKDHVGEDAVVSGTVLGLYIDSKNTNVYMYFDSDIFHPKFTAVWPGSNNPPVKVLEGFISKAETIAVSGKIITEKNVPEIVVGSWAQIN
jgi:hypothetical protein